MDKTIDGIKLAIAVIGGIIASALGGTDKLIYMLLFMVCTDLALGALKGAKNKGFSSSIFFWGLINKAIIFVVVALMVQVDNALGKIGFLRNAFLVWFGICEGASIIENSAALGIPWPDGLLKVLVQVRKGFSINLSKIVQKIIEEYIPDEKKEDDVDD